MCGGHERYEQAPYKRVDNCFNALRQLFMLKGHVIFQRLRGKVGPAQRQVAGRPGYCYCLCLCLARCPLGGYYDRQVCSNMPWLV